ncbi:MAG: DNA replication and repair protein RecF [Verrucomicrobiales bacterium]|nr:DNA replication and repair protein RecF [Verrucomicrobiales bacterium]
MAYERSVLSSLKASQFRCFDSLRLTLEPGVTLFVGDNAQGKTTILEAACVLLRLQSPRASQLGETIRIGHDACAIGGSLAESELLLQYSEKAGRKLRLDGETQRRSADYLRASELVVWMANDDLALVRGGGEGRRRYLDFMAAQLYPAYRPALQAYDRALRSRNFLLKRDASPRWAEIDAYTRLLAQHGEVLTRHRREVIDRLAPYAAEAQRQISDRDEDLRIAYEPGTTSGDAADDLATELIARRDEEFRKRQTIAGPHRDDLSLAVNNLPAAKFASEGQQRTVALALKLAQSRLFLEMRRRPPLLLVDDVFGELDPGRRNALMAAWPADSQKLITTTHLHWLDDRFASAAVITVTGGQVAPANR